MRSLLWGVAVAALLLPAFAYALETTVGYVTIVQPTYMPATVSFQLDAGTTSCPAGAWLSWQNADTSNNRAVLATLLTAQVTRQRVRIYFNDGDTACKGVFMHLISQ